MGETTAEHDGLRTDLDATATYSVVAHQASGNIGRCVTANSKADALPAQQKPENLGSHFTSLGR